MILNSFIEPAEPGLWRFWFDTLGISRRPPEPFLPDSQTGSAFTRQPVLLESGSCLFVN
jgi:hypothetical protein